MCQLGHFINSENFKPRVELESGGVMYQKEAHAFFVPLLYQLLDVYGGGEACVFFLS